MSGMASSNKMRPETKPSQTSGYARSPGRINSRSGAIPPRPSRFSRTGTYHEPSFFIRTSSKTAYYCKKETAHWISNALNPCEFICAFQIRSQSNFLRKKDFHRIEKEKNHNASWKKQSPILILSIDNKINKEAPIPFFADMRIWNPPQCMHMGYTKRKWMNIQKDF